MADEIRLSRGELRAFAEYARARYKTLSMREIAEQFKALKDKLDNAKRVKSELQKEYDILSKIVIPEIMEERETSFSRFPGIGSLGLRADLYVSEKKERQEEFHDWLRKRGYGYLLTEGVHYKRLQKFIKEMIVDGEEIPEEFVSYEPYDMAVLYKK